MSDWSRQRSALGAKLGELGTQQGELGKRKGEEVRKADPTMTRLTHLAFAKGLAMPVQ